MLTQLLLPLAVFVWSIDPSVLIQGLLAVVLPVLVGLVTTRMTSGGRKAMILAGLSVLTALLNQLATALAAGLPYDLGKALLYGLFTWAAAVATHYGLWKPTGTSERVQEAFAPKDS